MKKVKKGLVSHYIYFRAICIQTTHIPAEINSLTECSQCNSAFCQRLLKTLIPYEWGKLLSKTADYRFAPSPPSL